MKSATGSYGTIALFGGTSELGISTLLNLLSPTVHHVVLVSRNIDQAQEHEETLLAKAPAVSISHVRFDGADSESMQEVVKEVVALGGDIDVAIIAHALLGLDINGYDDPAAVKPLLDVNVTGTMTLMYALASQMKVQRHGIICLYSSVTGVRVRKANSPYGASKAAIDSFALALDHELKGSGVSVVVVRPGYVHTKMTAGMDAAPFATTADVVGKRAAEGIRQRETVVWVPGILRYVFGILRVLPLSVWRRLPIHD